MKIDKINYICNNLSEDAQISKTCGSCSHFEDEPAINFEAYYDGICFKKEVEVNALDHCYACNGDCFNKR